LLILILAAVTATGPIAMQSFLPALPAIVSSFEVSPGVAQLSLSLSLVAIALATLIYGPLSDRYGRRPVMLAGLIVFLGGSLLCAVAPNIEVLILGRVVQGAGGAAGMVLARAIARDLYGAFGAANVIARLTMIMVVAPMLAPSMGGLVSDLFGWRAIFTVVFAAGVVIVIGTLVLLQESHHERGDAESAVGMMRGFGMLASPRFLCLALYPAFSSIIFFSFISGAPYLMVNVMGRPAAEYGLLFVLVAAGFMGGNYIAVRFSHKVGHIVLMVSGMLMGLAGVATVAVIAANVPLNPWTLCLPIMVTQIGQGMGMPNAQAAAISVFPHRAGTASALTGFLQMLFAAIASQLVGNLQNGTPWPLLLGMAVGVAGALTAAVLAWSIDRPGLQTPAS
jgi:DHA1 family bicyclomycin/chloramphenicol resistance-like MFS transporter